jgi:hypothetical protein
VRKGKKRLRGKQGTGSRRGLVIALVAGGLFLGVCLPASVLGLYWAFGRGTEAGGGSASSSPLDLVEKTLSGSNASAKTRKLMVGTWESTEVPKGAGRRKAVIGFNEDGTVHLESGLAELGQTFRSLGMIAEFELHVPDRKLTYRLIADDRMEFAADLSDFGRQLGADPGRIAREFHKQETLTIAVSEKELSVTNDQGKTTTFRRLD